MRHVVHRRPLWAGVALTALLASACHPDAPAEDDASIIFESPDAGPDAAAPPAPTVGAPCTDDVECPAEASLCLLSDGFVDGYCTEFCLEDDPAACPGESL